MRTREPREQLFQMTSRHLNANVSNGAKKSLRSFQLFVSPALRVAFFRRHEKISFEAARERLTEYGVESVENYYFSLENS